MIARRLLLTLAATGALAVAGCGSDSSDSASTPAAPAAATTTEATESTPAARAPAASGDGVAVSMKGLQFEPKSVSVKVGQTITWTNKEPIPHNVIANDGADFKSEIFDEGKTFEYTADKAGTIRYECTLHPGMEGTIIVQ